MCVFDVSCSLVPVVVFKKALFVAYEELGSGFQPENQGGTITISE